MKKPSVILLGSKPGAVAALAVLMKRQWDIQYVVASQMDDIDWIPKPSLQELAKSNSLSILASQSDIPEDVSVDFVISYMYRNLVNPRTLNFAKTAALNFHAGPLPEFGGWAFYNVAILEQAREYGCTCHYMDENFDTGPLLKVVKFSIDSEQETALSLESKAQVRMIELFVEFCTLAESGESLPLVHQNPEKMRYLKKEEFDKLKVIPSDASPDEIDRRARAFWYPPYTCAYMIIDGNNVEVVPEVAKGAMAKNSHADDLNKLMEAAAISMNAPRGKA